MDPSTLLLWNGYRLQISAVVDACVAEQDKSRRARVVEEIDGIASLQLDALYAAEDMFFRHLRLILDQLETSPSTVTLDALRERASILVNTAWERLHSVHYAQVPREWHVLYTLASFTLALLDWQRGEFSEAMRCLDLALVMAGAPVLKAAIYQAIGDVLREAGTQVAEPGPKDLETNIQHLQQHLDAVRRDSLETVRTIRFPVPVFPVDTVDLSFLQSLTAPVVVRGAVQHWRALHGGGTRSWSLLKNLFRSERIAPQRWVPVEIGSSYTDHDWTQKIISIREFLARMVAADQPVADEKEGLAPRVYLAQHALFDQIPALWEDVAVPEYCQLPRADGTPSPHVRANFWLGPAKTRSPLHTDPQDNWFVQVVGYKYLRLYAPEETRRLYPYESGSMMSNTSQVVDLEQYDRQKYPLFSQAPYVEALVGPGEMLYVLKEGVGDSDEWRNA